MKLFLISQQANDNYDTFDSAVVAAETEDVARNMNPRDGEPVDWEHNYLDSWCCSPEGVTVKHIGDAVPGTQQGVICSSYNAG